MDDSTVSVNRGNGSITDSMDSVVKFADSVESIVKIADSTESAKTKVEKTPIP